MEKKTHTFFHINFITKYERRPVSGIVGYYYNPQSGKEEASRNILNLHSKIHNILGDLGK